MGPGPPKKGGMGPSNREIMAVNNEIRFHSTMNAIITNAAEPITRKDCNANAREAAATFSVEERLDILSGDFENVFSSVII